MPSARKKTVDETSEQEIDDAISEASEESKSNIALSARRARARVIVPVERVRKSPGWSPLITNLMRMKIILRRTLALVVRIADCMQLQMGVRAAREVPVRRPT
jgi:hypothetical protein